MGSVREVILAVSAPVSFRGQEAQSTSLAPKGADTD